MVVGCFLIRPIPLPSSESHASAEQGIGEVGVTVTSTSALIDDSRVRLLDREDPDVELDEPDVLPHDYIHGNPRSRSMSVSSSASSIFSRGQSDDDLPNIFGAELWKNGDFWLLFTILSIREYFLSSTRISPCLLSIQYFLNVFFRAFFRYFSLRNRVNV
jgi:hypothetical protein